MIAYVMLVKCMLVNVLKIGQRKKYEDVVFGRPTLHGW
jgi:hypothetical protein